MLPFSNNEMKMKNLYQRLIAYLAVLSHFEYQFMKKTVIYKTKTAVMFKCKKAVKNIMKYNSRRKKSKMLENT